MNILRFMNIKRTCRKTCGFSDMGFVYPGAYHSQARLLTLLRRSYADIASFGRFATLAKQQVWT